MPSRTVSPKVNQRDFESEKRLRKDLKRTKALLADAQIMLDHLKNNAPSKREIAQLKNQVPCSVESTGSRGSQDTRLFNYLFYSLLALKLRWLDKPLGAVRFPRVCVCPTAWLS